MSLKTASDDAEFSPWRSYLWPVHYYELKKLIPMLIIFFFISFDYNALRTLKDSLLITAKSSGAEVIPFVKVWAMFPGAVLMTLLFTYLSNRFSREKVFYIMMSIFLSYFFVFTFVLYPIRDLIHPHATADNLEKLLPLGFKGFVAMIRYWSFTLFYVMSELWSSVILSVLFWGFANQVTRLGEAKRFYGLFGVGANFSGIIAGQASVFCCSYTRAGGFFPIGEDPWHQSLVMIISLVLISGLFAVLLFRWMNANVLTDPRFYVEDDEGLKAGKPQSKMSLKQSFSVLLNSKYLICIALIVVSYNLVINLTEVIWKHQVKELYPNPNDYTMYMNQIVSIIGLAATFSSLFVSGNAIRKYGWTFTALLAPAVLLLTSIGFFTFFFFKQTSAEMIISLMGVSPLAVLVFLGSAQNILSRGAKYSVFDATKEMAFVPLNSETKLVGKAAIDGVCSRLGKSGGSVVHQGLLFLFSTLTVSAPYVAIVLLVVIGIWVIAIQLLGKLFNELSDANEQIFSSTKIEPQLNIRTVIPEHALLKEQTLLKERTI